MVLARHAFWVVVGVKELDVPLTSHISIPQEDLTQRACVVFIWLDHAPMALLRPVADRARGSRNVNMLQDERCKRFVCGLCSATGPEIGLVRPPQEIPVVYCQLQHASDSHPHLLVELPARGGLGGEDRELCGESDRVVLLQ